MGSVKKKRTYDARGRAEQAKRTREQVLEVARVRFLQDGYAKTTIAAIADEAGVSVETIYKAFGGKPGLVRAIYARALEGRGPQPAEQRSDAVRAHEEDPRAIIETWGRFVAEIAPLASPIMLLVRAGAAADADLAAVLREADEQRLARMRHNAEGLAKRRFLRHGISVDRAAEIMWLYTAPEVYELLCVRRGWSPAQLGAFVAEAMAAALL